jgi:REP element-mobilizing transposase RayT
VKAKPAADAARLAEGNAMDRYWLLTWTCYGQWLPGDVRGFVSTVEDDQGNRVIHNTPGTPYDADMPKLESYTRSIMKGSPVNLGQLDADALIAQYQETASIRGWELQAASVMYNHTHVIVGVPGDPDPKAILETLKSWATRALKKHQPLPPNGTFWTAKGSKRKLADERALRDGVIYVACKQPNPLAVWHHPNWQPPIDEFQASRTP